GHAVVFAAIDTVLQRRVAIKVLAPHLAATPEARSRFLREARAAARLQHPHVVNVFDISEDRGLLFIAMEYMAGGTLQSRLNALAGPLDWREATKAMIDACRGLAAAHAQGCVHRDLKPSNLMRTEDGLIKIGDFGLATNPDATSMTTAGAVLGTPNFMSPEQCRGERGDALSDVYALGATYFMLLTGSCPYENENVLQVMFAHCTATVPDASQRNPVVPSWCSAIVRRAMAKFATQRFSGAKEMLAALEQALAGAPATNGSTGLVNAAAQPPSAVMHRLPGAAAPPGPQLLPPMRGDSTAVEALLPPAVGTGFASSNAGAYASGPRHSLDAGPTQEIDLATSGDPNPTHAETFEPTRHILPIAPTDDTLMMPDAVLSLPAPRATGGLAVRVAAARGGMRERTTRERTKQYAVAAAIIGGVILFVAVGGWWLSGGRLTPEKNSETASVASDSSGAQGRPVDANRPVYRPRPASGGGAAGKNGRAGDGDSKASGGKSGPPSGGGSGDARPAPQLSFSPLPGQTRSGLGPVRSIFWSTDNQRIGVVTSSEHWGVRVFDVTQSDPLVTIPGVAGGAAFSVDGFELAVARDAGKIELYEVLTTKRRWAEPVGGEGDGGTRAIVNNPFLDFLALGDREPGTSRARIVWWDLRGRVIRKQASLATEHRPTAMAMAFDGKSVVIG
ncbi:MAG TPA: protein kinase, partial [Pirellulaceae bacterium]|nr:protein kinase [Pirellulaceae bacterium]